MTSLYQCDMCGTKYCTPEQALACEEQPVQSILEPETKILYHGKISRIGYKHFLNRSHVRVYWINIDARDEEDTINSSVGYVSETEFTVL